MWLCGSAHGAEFVFVPQTAVSCTNFLQPRQLCAPKGYLEHKMIVGKRYYSTYAKVAILTLHPSSSIRIEAQASRVAPVVRT